jgi:hypothetical protein
MPAARETELFKTGDAINILMENEKYAQGNVEV